MWCVRVHVLVCKELAFETVNWFVCLCGTDCWWVDFSHRLNKRGKCVCLCVYISVRDMYLCVSLYECVCIYFSLS